MRVNALGAVEVVDADRQVALSPQLMRLVGLLVVADGAVVTTDRVAEYAADGNAEGSTVRTAVSRLRKVLGDRVESVAGGYRLALAVDESDVARWERLVAESTSGDADVRIGLLRTALGLWRDRALGDLADEEWARGWAARLDESRAAATDELAALLLEVGRAAQAVELLSEHVAANPYRERPVGLLMRALAADGRVAEALRAFERFRVTLRDEAGLQPSPELREVEARLLGVVDGPSSPPASLPSGTVTFLFTDVEGSTQRWAADEAAMAEALQSHDAVLRDVVAVHGGAVFKHTGDGVCAVFGSATAAVSAAEEAQRRLPLPVRMGLHTGEAELRDGDYFGPTLNRVARIMDAGHGGQILVSGVTATLVPDTETTDLGEHELKGLASPERIVQIGTAEFPPLRVVSVRRGNLPSEPTSFVGRERELDELVDELVTHRLLTLVGVGGTGKTRLAIELAHAVAPTFPDGCWFIELVPVRDGDGVGTAMVVGAGLPVPMVGDVVDHLIQQIRHQRRLLVVDNCEHVLAAAAIIIGRIVDECPTVSVLATSREPLNVRGERLSAVPSLSHHDAVRLFHERAADESVSVAGDGAQERAVEEICRRLDGVPLAIELAAARSRAFTPVELAGMLDERFRVLVGGRRSRVERHQTLRGTLDWSYDLCTESERRTFDRLSVFPGQFDLAGARSVVEDDELRAMDVVDAVASLVDRSLVVRATGRDGTTRYSLLETMRAYGRDHLLDRGELVAMRDRHAALVEEAVRRHFPNIMGPNEAEEGRRLTEYLPDAAVAIDWLIECERWRSAEWAAWAGGYDGERFFWDGYAKVLAAMRESGLTGPDFDRVSTTRMAMDGAESREIEQEHYWRWLSAEPEPDEPPNLGSIGAEPSTPEQVGELLALIDRRRGREIGTVHLWRRWHALRHIAIAGFVPPPDEVDRFEAQARSIGSADGMCDVHEVRGQIAIADRDWEAAVEHFGHIVEHYRDRNMWIGHVSTWNWVSSRALAGAPVPPDELARCWTWLAASGFRVLEPRAAAATAVTLWCSGHEPLAERFVGWIRSRPDRSLLGLFEREFGSAGLRVDATSVADDDLDDLVAMLSDRTRLEVPTDGR